MRPINRSFGRWGMAILLFAHGMGAVELWAQGPPVIEQNDGPAMQNVSLIYIDVPPPPPEIKVHDIIYIEVDEKAEAIVNSRFNRQRNGSYSAALKQFIKFGPTNNLENAAENTPTIEGTLQNRLQALGTLTDSEGITFKIGATVVEVLPNGTLILEARKTIQANQDLFEYRLTGRVDKSALTPQRTVRTEKIAELEIHRKQKGKIFDSTKTNWGTRILDIITPF